MYIVFIFIIFKGLSADFSPESAELETHAYGQTPSVLPVDMNLLETHT
jgi:hypothetical protein